ncbi:hypothetical protein [Labrenzia sp. DG1229]|uniref:hypothetical protein n=1 Tax=Labrenzia sp. DG1229 TaxID=681847 RepID=UPI00048FB617|nr:hypothetical protein [Labrenzia sp. DG1229]
MARHFATILAFLFLVIPTSAEPELPRGQFNIINTAAFMELAGTRTAIDTGLRGGKVDIDFPADGSLVLTLGGTRIDLFPLEAGLAGLAWDADGTSLLHGIDIEAMNPSRSPQDIPSWGAELAWPGLGLVRLVMMPFGNSAYAGLLISYPGNRTVVRQMEFRQVFGPENRPKPSPTNAAGASNRY